MGRTSSMATYAIASSGASEGCRSMSGVAMSVWEDTVGT